jgi:hypothetical protein
MDVFPPTLDNSAAGPDSESAPKSTDPVYLFRASCPGLRDWSVCAGIDAAFIGVAHDPLGTVAELSASCHGSAGLVIDELMEDTQDWGRWTLSPFPDMRLQPYGHRIKAGKDWAGVVKLEVEGPVDLAALRRRFAALVAPLAVEVLFGSRRALKARQEREAMPPGVPRFTWAGGGYVHARGLYRLGDPADHNLVFSAFDAAAGTLGGGPGSALLDQLAAADADASGMGWPA